MSRSSFFVGLTFLLCSTVVPGQEPTPAKPATRRNAAARQAEPGSWHATGTHGAVAAGGQEAVDAGIRILPTLPDCGCDVVLAAKPGEKG